MTPTRLFLPLTALLVLASACFGGDDASNGDLPAATTIATRTSATREPQTTREPANASPTASARTPLPTPAANATPANEGTRRPDTPSPGASPTPEPDLAFHFGDDVPVFERTLIVTAIEVTRELLAADARVSPPVSVFAYNNLDALIQDYQEHARAQPWRVHGMFERLTNAVAESSYRGVVINTGHRAWRILTDADLMRAVAHEYVHVVQLENAGAAIADETLRSLVDTVPPAGPLWLLEGSAEVVSYLVADRLDIEEYPATLVDLGIQARDNPVPLANLETYLEFYAGGDDGIARSVLATDYLLRNRDLSELFQFWEDIRRGSRWEEAFIRRFGTNVETFYANFDAYYNATFGR